MQKIRLNNKYKAFTLIELLVVIAILGILLALTVFGMQDARRAARDSRRKSDLEQIRSGLEMYKADCNTYYTGAMTPGATIHGSGAPTTCAVANVYINKVPGDPLTTTNTYSYTTDGSTYTLCAALEQNPGGDTAGCGSCTVACNYKVTSP